MRRLAPVVGRGFLAGALVLLGIACALTPPAGAPVATSPPKQAKPASESPAPRPGSRTPARVVRIIDGDTIEVDIDGRRDRVRLIGINTPETKHPTKGIEPYGPEAEARTAQLLASKAIVLERDVTDRDHYRRLLRYVWLDEALINAQLVEEGYAQVTTYPPDVRYADRFLELQRAAQAAGRGLWSPGTAVPPPPPEIEPTWEDVPDPPTEDGPTWWEGVRDPTTPTPWPTPWPTATIRPGFTPRAYIPPEATRAYTCRDFQSQGDAQAVLRADPRDPNRLDAPDRNGIACDSRIPRPPHDRDPVFVP